VSRRILVLLALAAPAAGDELADARRQLASKSAEDRLAAIKKLAHLDSRGAIEALAEAIKKSGVEMDRLGKKLDKADLDWGKAFDKRMALEARGKIGTEAYRSLQRKEGQLLLELGRLGDEAGLHLKVLESAGDALPAFKSAEAVEAIEKRARSHPHPTVRMLYIRGLGHESRKRSVPLLLELLDHKDPRVRAMAVRSLGPFALEERVTTRIAELGEEPAWAMRRGAYEVMARAHVAAGVPVLIRGARREKGEMLLTVYAFLKHMTGASVADDPDAWASWFEINAEALRKGTYEKPEDVRSEPLEGETRSVPTFFRIPIESTNVVFAIDVSGSMRLPVLLKEIKSRLAYAQAELIGALKKLPDGALFNIVAYSDRAHFYSKGMKVANASARAAAIKWVTRMRAEGLTNLWDGLNLSYNDYLASSGGAVRFSKLPDTIVFLTDGNATRGRFRDTDALRRLVRIWNMPLDMVIHCVGIGEDHDRALLRALAEQTGGAYVDLQRGFDKAKPRQRKMPPR
jgi:HEAT repeat protein